MKRIFAVFKKEIKRFFTDTRMLMALIIPGVVIFVTYTLMGHFFSPEKIGEIDNSYQFNIAITNNYNEDDFGEGKPNKGSALAQGISSLFKGLTYEKEPNFIYIDKSSENDYKEKLKTNEIDSLIIYDIDNFDNLIIKDASLTKKMNIKIFFNSENKASEILFGYINQMVNMVYSPVTVNGGGEQPNVGHSSQMMSQILGMIIPMLSMSILFSVALTVCPESIAGEKERGTLSAILITPIKRSEFAIGKILALSVVSLFGGIISGLGMMLSLPNMIKGGEGINISGGAYALMFFILLLLMFFFVNIATTISTWAKSTKEATGYLGPMTAVLLIAGICPGLTNCSNIGFAFIPVLNAAQAIYSIIAGTWDIMFLITTLIMIIVYSAILIVIDVKMFKTESIVMRQ